MAAAAGYWACCGCSGVPPTPGKDAEISETSAVPSPYLEGTALESFKDPVQVNQKIKEDLAPIAEPSADPDVVQVQVVQQQEAKAPLRAVFRVPEPMEQVVRFQSRPLGLTFDPHSEPLKISSAVGQAAALGVQKGWTVKATMGREMATSRRPQGSPPEETDKKRPSWSRCNIKGEARTAPELFQSIKRNCEALPVVQNSGRLEVILQTDGVAKAFVFDRRPLGFSLSSTLPLQATNVTGQAAKLGVKAGSLVVSVGGHAVMDSGLPHAEVAARVSTLVQSLPYNDSPGGFPVVFADDIGQMHKVLFDYQPLGMGFARNAMPLKVSSVTPRAEDEGIKIGWTVRSVAGQDVTGPSWTYDKVEALLKCCLAPLPAQVKPKLDLVLVPDSGEVVVYFTRRPLDLSFKAGGDPTVAEASGHSMELGVKPDWVLCGVNNQDVSKLDKKEALKLLTEAESRLPLEAPPLPVQPKAPQLTEDNPDMGYVPPRPGLPEAPAAGQWES